MNGDMADSCQTDGIDLSHALLDFSEEGKLALEAILHHHVFFCFAIFVATRPQK